MTKGWLLSCGDALIDFMPTESKDGTRVMEPIVGGSCLNIAVAMARLGAPTGFVGALSTDMFGDKIAQHAEASGVDLRFCDRLPNQNTLAFIQLNPDNSASYAFYDEGSAARAWRFQPERFPWAEIAALHVGSTTLIDDPSSSETLALARAARAAGVLVSLDPNCRPILVKDRNDFRARIAAFAREATVIRMSDEDFEFLYGTANTDTIAEGFLAQGVELVVLTRGRHGATAWNKAAGGVHIPAPEIKIADTIGAGDTFLAALLVTLQDRGWLRSLDALLPSILGDCLRFAVQAAAITCSRPGANPPWRDEVA